MVSTKILYILQSKLKSQESELMHLEIGEETLFIVIYAQKKGPPGNWALLLP